MNKIDLRRIDLNLLVVFDVLMAERSVTRAAGRLGRTQSALSHALARLRAQLDDPLLVKAGGRMEASPFAEGLVEEVRVILSNIRRVLVPPQAFDAATTRREFRVASPDLSEAFFPRLAEHVRREAPLATLEWVTRDEHAALKVAEGQIDIALAPAIQALPDGLAYAELPPFKWASFVRAGHPALKGWGKAAWAKWPHVAVRIDARIASPVDAAFGGTREQRPGQRRIGAWVPHFSAVAPLLARTDMIAALPMLVMADRLERYGLIARKAPIRIEPMPYRLVWSARLAKDPAMRWLHAHVEKALGEVLAAADAAMPA